MMLRKLQTKAKRKKWNTATKTTMKLSFFVHLNRMKRMYNKRKKNKTNIWTEFIHVILTTSSFDYYYYYCYYDHFIKKWYIYFNGDTIRFILIFIWWMDSCCSNKTIGINQIQIQSNKSKNMIIVHYTYCYIVHINEKT